VSHKNVPCTLYYNSGISYKVDFYCAMLYMLARICCRRVSVCLSVCLSQAGTVPKRLNYGSRKHHNTIADGL